MLSLRFFSNTVAAFLLAGCATLPANPADAITPATGDQAATPARPDVVLISIDGFRAEYLQRNETPVLAQLAAGGTRAQWLIPSFPTFTYPNHYAMVTGRYPDHNGIVDNYFQDPDLPGMRFAINNFQSIDDPRWWDEATPIWYTLQQASERTAEMDWPGADIARSGVVPSLEGTRNEPEVPALRADTVVNWLGLPPWQRPKLSLVHFELVDATGHIRGPDSPQMDAALRRVDAAVGQIVQALRRDGEYDNTDLIVVSDHGMRAVEPDQIIYIDDIISVAAADVVTQDSLAGFDPHNNAAGRTAAASLLRPHQHMHCWRRQDLPVRYHYGTNRRVPRIECLADAGWLIETHRFASLRKSPLRGEHGYDNILPSMRAIFIAEGPSFQRGMTVSAFPNVDLYPLLAHILRVAPEANDGDYSQVSTMLKPATR